MSNGTGDWAFFHEKLLDILRDTSPERPMQKKKMLELLKLRHDLEPSRTTLDKKLEELGAKGYALVDAGRKGFYLNKNDGALSDGELRFLIDSIMYSRIIPEDDSAELIKKIAKLGSGTFEKEMKKRAHSAVSIEKDAP